jgi:cytochrome c oxidase subunit 2
MLSTLQPAGRDAVEIAQLFWIMAAGATAVWLVVTALALHALRQQRSLWTERAGNWVIAAGGVIVPVVMLGALLLFGMPALRRQLAAAPGGEVASHLRVHVTGEQWWWRVRYERAGAAPIELANELRLPRGQSAEVILTSADVIHSFWIPSLAGKVDMLPGRTTRLTLEPHINGIFRGVCAEYCGESHARMGFAVEVMEPAAFDAWLAAQARPADSTASGLRLFETSGCGACHAIRGTGADATIGPDLTHVGSRLTLAGGALPNTAEHLALWIARPNVVKPGSLMPPFAGLPAEHVRALVAFLQGLR